MEPPVLPASNHTNGLAGNFRNAPERAGGDRGPRLLGKAELLPAETGLLGDHVRYQGLHVISNLCLCKAGQGHPSPDSNNPAQPVPSFTSSVPGTTHCHHRAQKLSEFKTGGVRMYVCLGCLSCVDTCKDVHEYLYAHM